MSIEVVCAADNRFIMPLTMTLRSAAAYASQDIRAFVLTTDIDAAAKRRVETACASLSRPLKIEWVDVDDAYLRDVPRGLSHLSRATYLRLTIGRLIPANVSRVIYLDCDVLVSADLSPMWELDLDGNVIGAVRDFLTPLVGQENSLGYCNASLGIASNKPMFNAGIMLMDLVEFRRQDIEGQCLAFILKWKDQIRSADQDALNAVLHDHWNEIDYRWNMQPAGIRVITSGGFLTDDQRRHLNEVEPAILHYVGADKPWNSGMRSTCCQQYVDFLGSSGFYGPVSFRLWQAKRLMVCVRRAATNRLAAYKTTRLRESQPPAAEVGTV
jgi:lipopolysaccharide biosynthesis glycosyltransferase